MDNETTIQWPDFTKGIELSTPVRSNLFASGLVSPLMEGCHPVQDDILRKTDEQNNLILKQNEMLAEQNRILSDERKKLAAMCDTQSRLIEAAQAELQKNHAYNKRMMIIATVAMVAAIAGPIVNWIVSK